jgi:homocysteine S-methyltransferase
MNLKQKLSENNTLILDGGFGTTLESLGCNINSSLWSAEYLIADSQMIEQAHYLFAQAGADIILTSTYQAAYPSFRNAGFNSTTINQLLQTAVDVTQKSKNAGALIVGSLGPYAAYLADGSEYTGDYNVSAEEYFLYHKERVQSLINYGITDFVFETIPKFDEIKAVTELIIPYFNNHHLTFWLSCTVNDNGDLSDGTDFSTVCEYISEHQSEWSIFGINCSTIDGIESSLSKGLLNTPQYTALYPNGGRTYDASTKTWSGIDQSSLLLKYAPKWRDQGINIIGGCCGILPEDINQLSKVVHSN